MKLLLFAIASSILFPEVVSDEIIGPVPNVVGDFSVIRLGKDNTAKGKYCTTGGGRKNEAGSGAFGGSLANYVVVGGGDKNKADAPKSVISGGISNSIVYDGMDNDHCVISGGVENGVELKNSSNAGSVITGGSKNKWFGAQTATIGGGNENIVSGKNSVVTGGQNNRATGLNSVVLGGRNNEASGDYSVVPGGNGNVASGRNSIAMGQKAIAKMDSSMAINLQGVNKEIETDKEGQLLIQAKKYRFQISKEAGQNDENVFVIDENNIKNLRDAINAQPGRRRELRKHYRK